MNCYLLTHGRVVLAIIFSSFVASAATDALAQEYQAPNFASMASQAIYNQPAPPVLPASPLAGGPAAADGVDFMDAQGRPVVLQTQYSAPMGGGYPPGGAAGFCPPGAGYGDPMAVDFGGYGQDQAGPHYYDVRAGAVFLQAERLLSNVGGFTAPGAGSPERFLDISEDYNEFEAGWQIAGRYDIGALAVLEGAYMGVYDFGFSDSVNSADVAAGGLPSALVSVFNNYGLGDPIAGIDQGITHAIDYEAELHSTEINYRRYWLGNNTRVSGTWLIGARYLRYTDAFEFNSTGIVGAGAETAALQWENENDLVGCHFGGDAWLALRQGLRLGLESTAGIYNNRFKLNNSGAFSTNAATAPVGVVVPVDFDDSFEGNQVAFASEADVTMVADILPSLSLSGGYQVLYMNSIAAAAGNVGVGSIGSGVADTQSSLVFQGFHAELEYIW